MLSAVSRMILIVISLLNLFVKILQVAYWRSRTTPALASQIIDLKYDVAHFIEKRREKTKGKNEGMTEQVSIRFVTLRNRMNSDDLDKYFGGRRERLRGGTC